MNPIQIIKDIKYELCFAVEYAKYKRRVKKHSKVLEAMDEPVDQFEEGLDLQDIKEAREDRGDLN